jgi:7-cyano-7-deazaguanine synthase
MSQTSDRAVAVLTSGGLDSAVLCVDMIGDFRRVIPIYVRSGLVWENAELAALERFLKALKTEALSSLVVLEEPIADVYGSHWSTSGAGVPSSESADQAVYLPGRNFLLTVKAAIWCRLRNVEALALGSLGSNPFADSTPEFFATLQNLLNRALGGELRLVRPFNRLQKAEVLLRGKHLPLHLTFSCINPVRGLHCGQCNKCAERKKGFQSAGIVDTTPYAAGPIEAPNSTTR